MAETIVCGLMASSLDDERFALSPSGRFRERMGGLGAGAAHSSKKLCLVATDAGFLADFLYTLSLRADCYFVKYGTIAREGMYLGRCSLATDRAAGELCQALKGHPRLMASLQDDAWFEEFRDQDIPDGGYGVWDYLSDRDGEVADVLRSAFQRADEAELVAALGLAGAATVSLVAQVPPPDRGREPWPIIGHVLLSPVEVDDGPASHGLGLGPLAVLEAHRRKGVGAALVEAALGRARLLGYRYVVVLGSAHYYSRFGFVPALRYGLSYPDRALQSAFMALELAPEALAHVSGMVRYHPAFYAAAKRSPADVRVG